MSIIKYMINDTSHDIRPHILPYASSTNVRLYHTAFSLQTAINETIEAVLAHGGRILASCFSKTLRAIFNLVMNLNISSLDTTNDCCLTAPLTPCHSGGAALAKHSMRHQTEDMHFTVPKVPAKLL